jgi:transposase
MALVAKRFGVSLASVMRWSKTPESKTTRNKPATKIDMEALKMDVETYPDAYQYERAGRLGVSKSCVGYALKRLGVSYKKNAQSPQGGSRKTLCFLPRD